MNDHPVEAYRRKPDSSLRRSLEDHRAGKVDAVVSAGNTGAAMTCAFLILGTAPGVTRPAIATPLPTLTGKVLLTDAGANVDCDASNLCQFALMGSTYARSAWDVNSPKVALLNIGEEASKGNTLTKQAHELLLKSDLNFVGNVEPKDVFAGSADVIVCDGFVGNIMLKTSEGMAEMIGASLREIGPDLDQTTILSALSRMRSRMDYSAYGGAPLLGLNGACFISHGRSKATAVANALRAAAHAAQSGVVARIQEDVQTH
jgi:glycerol-3-phosphate acyltransferase PlsX